MNPDTLEVLRLRYEIAQRNAGAAINALIREEASVAASIDQALQRATARRADELRHTGASIASGIRSMVRAAAAEQAANAAEAAARTALQEATKCETCGLGGLTYHRIPNCPGLRA